MKTELKCEGCQKEIPHEHYNSQAGRATWFGIFTMGDLTSWVCVDCWDKGKRYKGFVDRKNVPLE